MDKKRESTSKEAAPNRLKLIHDKLVSLQQQVLLSIDEGKRTFYFENFGREGDSKQILLLPDGHELYFEPAIIPTLLPKAYSEGDIDFEIQLVLFGDIDYQYDAVRLKRSETFKTDGRVKDELFSSNNVEDIESFAAIFEELTKESPNLKLIQDTTYALLEKLARQAVETKIQ